MKVDSHHCFLTFRHYHAGVNWKMETEKDSLETGCVHNHLQFVLLFLLHFYICQPMSMFCVLVNLCPCQPLCIITILEPISVCVHAHILISFPKFMSMSLSVVKFTSMSSSMFNDFCSWVCPKNFVHGFVQ